MVPVAAKNRLRFRSCWPCAAQAGAHGSLEFCCPSQPVLRFRRASRELLFKLKARAGPAVGRSGAGSGVGSCSATSAVLTLPEVWKELARGRLNISWVAAKELSLS